MSKKKKKHASDSDASASDASASNASSSDASSSDASTSSTKTKKSKKHGKDKEKKVKGKKEKKGKSSKKEKKEKSKPSKKDKKEKKSGKRGPKGAQWLTWKIPYQESSILGKSFTLAQKKGGVDIKKLSKQIKAWGGTPAFIIRKLRKGHSKGFKWEVDDSHGRLRILNSKLANKHWKKA